MPAHVVRARVTYKIFIVYSLQDVLVAVITFIDLHTVFMNDTYLYDLYSYQILRTR